MTDIRAVTTADYVQLADFLTELRPHHPPDAAELLHHDRHTPADRRRLRLIAVADGMIVGHAAALQFATYPADFYDLMIEVAPDFRRRGLARRLYHALCGELRDSGTLTLSAEVRTDWPAGLAFAAALGFREQMRTWESALDLMHCDLERFSQRCQAVTTAGYQITTLAALLRADADGAARRLYEALALLQRDVPRAAPYSHPSFEVWLANSLHTPDIMLDGYFIAVNDTQIVGVSQLWAFREPGALLTGLTAVHPDHRRRGLALALKCTALAYARAAGYREVRTGNASTNYAMIAINDALGFVRYPAWLQMVLRTGSAHGSLSAVS